MDELHGMCRTWDDEGTLVLEEPYRAGAAHGIWREWAPNGTLIAESAYYDGRKWGEARTWLPDGRPRRFTFYTEGWEAGYGIGRQYEYADIDNRDEDDSYKLYITRYDWDTGQRIVVHYVPPPPMESLPLLVDPTLPEAVPDPVKDPGPPENPNRSIAGRVRCGRTNLPLAGVSVSAGTFSTVTQDGGGYQLSVGNQSSVELTFSKSGYGARRSSVSLSGAQRRIVNVTLSDGGDVTDVTSRYGRIFLQGLPVYNEYTALVDWGDGGPGSVVFRRNGSEHTVSGTSSGAAITFNMGSDFNPTFMPQGNRLSVLAVDAEGARSAQPFEVNPVVLPLPPWSLSLGLFDVEQSGDAYTYKLDASFPSEPMAIEVSPEALGSTLWAAWGFVPVVGGQKFGIPPSQLNFEVAVSTEGSGSIGASAVMGFQVAGTEIETTLGGKGNVAYDMVGQKGLTFKGAELSGGVKGTAKREFGPVELIPNLAGAVNLPILGRPISWFNQRAKIDATIMLGGELKFVLVDEGGGVVFDRSEGTLSGGIGLGMGGDIGSLKARVSGGGETKLTYQLPPDPDYLKSVEAEVEAKLELAIWSYETEFSAKGSMTYPSASASSGPLRASAMDLTPVTRLMNTDFVDREPYQVFRGGSPARAMSADAMSAGEEPFISNVFPYAEPALATFDTGAALAYVAYDPEQPVTQGNELWVAFQKEGNWNPPTRVTDDSHNDYAPSLAYAADGKLVMIWERVRPALFNGDSPEALAPHLEIAYSVYDPAAGSWSAPAFLSNNTVLDFAPYLARSPDGELKAFWLHSPGNQLIGDADDPVRLYSATWNGTGFDAPVIHPHGFKDAWDFSFAYDGERARVAWIQDADGDVTTLGDQQVYYSVFDGLGWGNPVALHPDPAAPAGRPALLCVGPDQWELFWQRGDDLVRMTDWGTQAVESVREDSGGFAFANFHVSGADDGRILLIWQGMGESSPDVFCRIYDAEHGVWSEDLRLTQQAGQEAALAGNLQGDGTLRLFFTRARVDGSGATDLLHVERRLANRLVAERERFDLAPEKPKLGEAMSLTAYVRNAGERALANLVAEFYLGDPEDGGVLIESVVVEPAILPAGAEGNATLADWTLPSDIGMESIFVLFTSPENPLHNDPAEHIAGLSPVRVDVAVSHIEVGEPAYGGEIDILATIANHGNAIARDIDIQLGIDDLTQPRQSLPVLLPGMTAQVGFTVAGNSFHRTRTTVYVDADPDRLLPDIQWDNNLHEVVVNRVKGFSSMDDGVDDDWKLRHFGHLEVDPDDDPDRDGLTNQKEFLLGTDPLDPGSFFGIKQKFLDAFGTVRLNWPARAAQRYRVEKSYDLENWEPLPVEHTAFRDGSMSVVETNAIETKRVFYRVRLID